MSDYISRQTGTNVPTQPTIPPMPKINRNEKMTDYISRQAAIDKTYKLREHFKCWDRYDDVEIRKGYAAIPAADVVEVVRCKDCKHRKKNTFCLHNMRYEQDSGFCSYGERADK